jgi:hypothetical protein
MSNAPDDTEGGTPEQERRDQLVPPKVRDLSVSQIFQNLGGISLRRLFAEVRIPTRLSMTAWWLSLVNRK